MARLTNTWVSYFDRTYQQIKDTVLIGVPSKLPEITDHNETNIIIKILSIISGLIEMLGYYVDTWGQESYITTCRLYSSAVKIANKFDYRIASMLAASVDVTFTLKEINVLNVTIPQGTELETSEPYTFYTTEQVIIIAGNLENTVSAIQKVAVSEVALGVSTGEVGQVFELPDVTIVDKSAVISVLTVNWSHVETFAYSSATDTHFRMSVSVDRKPVIEFGDDINGAIPQNGATINIAYQVCNGVNSNIARNELTKIVTSLTLPSGAELNCNNDVAASGGADIESLTSLKTRIPLSIKTLQVAVTEQNFLDIANQAPSVLQTALWYECGKNVKLYIVPIGGGYASETLCTEVVLYFENRKLFNTTVDVYPAGSVELMVQAQVEVKSDYQNASVKQAVVDNLVEEFSMENQNIGGSLKISDIYQIIENTTGVENSVLNVLTAKPYARSVDDFKTLNWDLTLKETGDSPLYWSIVFVSTTQFQVFQGTNFKGVYSIGNLVSFIELDFVVLTGTYVLGDKWEFYTYPNSITGAVELQEYSIPVIQSTNAIITVTGGI